MTNRVTRQNPLATVRDFADLFSYIDNLDGTATIFFAGVEVGTLSGPDTPVWSWIVGKPISSVEESATLADALVAARGAPMQLRGSAGAYEITSGLTIADDTVADLVGSTITQANDTDLPALVTVNMLLATGIKRSDLSLFVDGNRENNADVTGVVLQKIRKAFSSTRIGAVNCDTAVEIPGDTEFAKVYIGADSCGVVCKVVTDEVTSPDELMLDITAHEVDTVLQTSGPVKSSGTVRIAAEQIHSWGVDLDTGFLELHGILRACGIDGGGGYRQGAGLENDGMLYVGGELIIVGGSDTNCAWAVDLVAGAVAGMKFRLLGSYAGGARINADVEAGSSAMFDIAKPPASDDALLLYDAAESGSVLDFHVLPGTRIYHPGGVAVNLERATGCTLEPSVIQGEIVIGANSGGNVINIPRSSFNNVTFTNNRSANDNRIVFRGRRTLSELEGLSTKFEGMYAEQVPDFNGAPAYYDGTKWRSWVNQTRVTSTATSANPIFNATDYDQLNVTGQTVNLASINMSGAPHDGQSVRVRLKDNGVSRTITLGAELRALVPIPEATTPGETLYLDLVYNAADTIWDVISATYVAA